MNKSPVIFIQDCKCGPFPKNSLNATARSVYRREKIHPGRKIHVIFCSDYTIKKLNSMFRGKNRPTDVLSFNYDDKDLLGEIYISLQRARVQARRYDVSYNNEILRLFVHGMHHLLGFDHERPGDKRKMEAKEIQYL
jgi:probable rRNA maturation factor